MTKKNTEAELKYLKILGIKINNVNMGEAINIAINAIKNNSKKYFVTANPEMIIRAQQDSILAEIINKSSLSVPDGAGVVLASKLSKKRLNERVAGFDLMQKLMEVSAREKYSIFMLGSEPGVIEISRQKALEKFPGINICGISHGYLNEKQKQKVIENINKLKPDILFIGMGIPLQEKFIYDNLSNLNVKLTMPVGGSFDVLAGRIKRAPEWMQRVNLEWFYRLIQEPTRLGRMMALPKFAFLVLLEYIRGGFHENN